MSEALIVLLIVAGGILTIQNAVVGMRTGKIELKSVVVDRSEQPGLFWFALVTEALFIVAIVWLFAGWVTGSMSFGFGQ